MENQESNHDLVAAQAVASIQPTQSDQLVEIAADDKRRLDGQIIVFLRDVREAPLHSEKFQAMINSIDSLGNREIQHAASVSSRLLDKPNRVMREGSIADSGYIGNALSQLKTAIDELDPSNYGNLFEIRKFLGLIPIGNKLSWYFAKYESSRASLNEIVKALFRSQDEVKKENAAIDQEKQNLWQAIQALRRYSYISEQLDSHLTDMLPQISTEDADRARLLSDQILFSIRQKRSDLLTQQAVSLQGFQAMDLIRQNNLQLDKGIARACSTTLAALQTAIMVASALTKQKLVIDAVRQFNRIGSGIVENSARMAKHGASEVNKSAKAAEAELDQLKLAFNKARDSMNSVSNFKSAAQSNMLQSFEQFSTDLQKAEANSAVSRQAGDGNWAQYFEFTE